MMRFRLDEQVDHAIACGLQDRKCKKECKKVPSIISRLFGERGQLLILG